jgi:putative FmdB family regulatory protein
VPTYEYACTECADRLEVVQSFSDDPLTVCLACGGRLRKVFSPVGIVFKGSGFYRTDSRAKDKEKAPAGSTASGDGAAAKADAGSADGGKTASADGPAARSGKGKGRSGAAPEPAAKSKSAPAGSKVA